jgi:hypothetical protein
MARWKVCLNVELTEALLINETWDGKGNRVGRRGREEGGACVEEVRRAGWK